jgi:predicted transcriptional regulator
MSKNNNIKKGVIINLDEKSIQSLHYLAEKNISSKSQIVRRLIHDERERVEREEKKIF